MLVASLKDSLDKIKKETYSPVLKFLYKYDIKNAKEIIDRLHYEVGDVATTVSWSLGNIFTIHDLQKEYNYGKLYVMYKNTIEGVTHLLNTDTSYYRYKCILGDIKVLTEPLILLSYDNRGFIRYCLCYYPYVTPLFNPPVYDPQKLVNKYTHLKLISIRYDIKLKELIEGIKRLCGNKYLLETDVEEVIDNKYLLSEDEFNTYHEVASTYNYESFPRIVINKTTFLLKNTNKKTIGVFIKITREDSFEDKVRKAFKALQ